MSEDRFIVNVPSLGLRATPEGTIDADTVLTRNQTVQKISDPAEEGWWEIQAIIDGSSKTGFVQAKHLSPRPSQSQAVDSDAVVDLCRTFARQFQTSSVLLIAIAYAESDLESKPRDASGRVGLFGYRQDGWDVLIARHSDTGVTSAMIDEWGKQIIIAAAACGADGQSLREVLNRSPTALEVYAAHRLGLSLAKTLIAAPTSNGVEATLGDTLSAGALANALSADVDVLGAAGSGRTVGEALRTLEARLDSGIKRANKLNAAVVNERLGNLSRSHESNGKPEAIGFDDAGGWSYGLYQLASRRGSVETFLDFLHDNHPNFAQALESAGGDAAARAGSATFKTRWRDLADDPIFSQAQHSFIKSHYFDVCAGKLASGGFPVTNRSGALQDVVWSVAVQHGPSGGFNLFQNALTSFADPRWSDDAVTIKAVYDERSNLEKYFPNARREWKGLAARFVAERAQALAMLA